MVLMRSPGAACRALARTLRRLLREKRGTALVTFAFAVPAMAGVTSMAVESGLWYLAKRGLQNEADAAARSGAYERAKGNPSGVNAASLKEAIRNGFVNAAPNTIAINNPPLTGAEVGNGGAVEVILTQPQKLLLASYFIPGVTVRARAVALVKVTGTACVLALDPTASGAIQNQGNPTIKMDGCVLASNSTSSSAITVSGSANLEADSLWTAGNISVSSSATLTLDRPATVNAWAIQDPYDGVTIPPLAACDHSGATYNNVTLTINPGVYCDGINFGSNAIITLNPGTYYVNRGDVTIAATAVLRCACLNPGDGVTFVLTSTTGPGNIGAVVIAGGADVVLNAPTSNTDPYKGLLVYQDDRAPIGQTVKFNGGSKMLLTGGIYIPNQVIEWSGGNAASGSTCTQIIGRVVKFVGNSEIVNTGCDAAGISPLQIVGVRIVE